VSLSTTQEKRLAFGNASRLREREFYRVVPHPADLARAVVVKHDLRRTLAGVTTICWGDYWSAVDIECRAEKQAHDEGRAGNERRDKQRLAGSLRRGGLPR